ncbi:MAG: hypothetical protein ABIH38_01485 [Patescibacteria group bacterium]
MKVLPVHVQMTKRLFDEGYVWSFFWRFVVSETDALFRSYVNDYLFEQKAGFLPEIHLYGQKERTEIRFKELQTPGEVEKVVKVLVSIIGPIHYAGHENVLWVKGENFSIRPEILADEIKHLGEFLAFFGQHEPAWGQLVEQYLGELNDRQLEKLVCAFARPLVEPWRKAWKL